MKLISKFLIQIIANLIAVLAANYLIKGFTFSGNFLTLLEVSLGLTLFNLIIVPILKFFLTPLIILTLGVINIAINALGLWLASNYFSSLSIVVGNPLIYSAILFGVINSTLALIFVK